MESDYIKNSDPVKFLERLVEECGSQHAAAKALGDKSFQSSISNALRGVRMPSKSLLKAIETYRSKMLRGKKINSLLVEMQFVRETKNTYRYDAIDDGADLKSTYIPKARMGAEPTKFIEVEVKWSAASGEQSVQISE